MEHKIISKLQIKRNRDKFYHTVYKVLRMDKTQLINLDDFTTSIPILIVDSCAWYYKKHFQSHNIIQVENVLTCKHFDLAKDQVDKIYTEHDRNNIKWPKSIYVPGSVLILDYSNLTQYRTIPELTKLLTDLTTATNAEIVRMRMSIVNSGDYRFTNRVMAFSSIVPEKYVIENFIYNNDAVVTSFRRKKLYGFCIN
jgi:hypothetical protein